jgi:hypothetical protein
MVQLEKLDQFCSSRRRRHRRWNGGSHQGNRRDHSRRKNPRGSCRGRENHRGRNHRLKCRRRRCHRVKGHSGLGRHCMQNCHGGWKNRRTVNNWWHTLWKGHRGIQLRRRMSIPMRQRPQLRLGITQRRRHLCRRMGICPMAHRSLTVTTKYVGQNAAGVPFMGGH